MIQTLPNDRLVGVSERITFDGKLTFACLNQFACIIQGVGRNVKRSTINITLVVDVMACNNLIDLATKNST